MGWGWGWRCEVLRGGGARLEGYVRWGRYGYVRTGGCEMENLLRHDSEEKFLRSDYAEEVTEEDINEMEAMWSERIKKVVKEWQSRIKALGKKTTHKDGGQQIF